MKFCDFILCSPKISLAGVENKYLEQQKKKCQLNKEIYN